MAEKLGLALSGGGFRAAFFHIGVLAQMADLGLLRHVEVPSTVSGGSIIGALYYLHLKRLLESKTDGEIKDQDYKAFIEQIEGDFLRAVQRNIRMRTFLNPLKNLRMSRANYSRSDRIGELYDEYFYRRIADPKGAKPVEMRELKIAPKGTRTGFHPLRDNVGRRAKVPILLINATTLNTGHNWRFEASRMGEPPRNDEMAKEIDKNLRLLQPPSYEAVVLKQQNIELGHAVAASASVPGIFAPLAISGLYPRGIRVQLVDGGVHDNQGVQGLLDTDCTIFVVSDASGQMVDELDPSTALLALVGRSNSILMDRVREEQLFGLLQGKGSAVALMHLRKGLVAEAVPWIGPDGRVTERSTVEREPEVPSERFGVAQQVQALLAKVRTDLDSFTEVEAYSLMLDGYLMSQMELPKAGRMRELIPQETTVDAPRWHFLRIAPWMARPTPRYLRQLKVASRQLFKVFGLSRPVTAATLLAVLAILAVLGAFFWDEIKRFLSSSVTMGQLLLAAVVLALGFAPVASQALTVPRFLRAPREFLVRFLTRALVPVLGALFVWVYLLVFDALFLRLGTMEKLRREKVRGQT